MNSSKPRPNTDGRTDGGEPTGEQDGATGSASAADARSLGQRARRGGFYLVALLILAMTFAFVGFLIQWGVVAWFSTEFGVHRIHQIVDGMLIGAIALGVLVQLYRPIERVAALQSTVIVMAAFSTFALAGGAPVEEILPFVVLTALLALLHPVGRDLVRPFTVGRFSPRLAALALVALVPLGAFAAHQFGLQLSLTGEHAAVGHWGSMAAASTSVVLLALLASLKTRMWLWPAVLAGTFAGAHGLASILFETASGVGSLWGGLELLWALVFLAISIAEYRGLLGPTDVAPVPEPASR